MARKIYTSQTKFKTLKNKVLSALEQNANEKFSSKGVWEVVNKVTGENISLWRIHKALYSLVEDGSVIKVGYTRPRYYTKNTTHKKTITTHEKWITPFNKKSK